MISKQSFNFTIHRGLEQRRFRIFKNNVTDTRNTSYAGCEQWFTFDVGSASYYLTRGNVKKIRKNYNFREVTQLRTRFEPFTDLKSETDDDQASTLKRNTVFNTLLLDI